MGNYSSTLQQRDRVLSVYERVLPATDPLRISAMCSKAGALDCVDRLDESLALFKAAVKLGRKVFKEDSGELLRLEGSMAAALEQSGKREEAVEVYERLIEVRERSPLYGPSHELTWKTRADLGSTLVGMGKFTEAIPLLCDSLAAYDGMRLGPDHPELGFIPQYCGRALLGAGRPAEAVPLFQRCIAFTERKHGPFHFDIPRQPPYFFQ